MTTLLYSGNLGFGHELGTLLQAVHALRGEVDLRLILVGTGRDSGAIRRQIEDLRLDNAELRPPVPLEWLPELLAGGDVHIVAQKPRTQGLIVPSKIYGTLAAGRPTVFIGPPDCDAADVLRRSASGFIVAPGDVRGVMEALRRLATDATLRRDMGRRASDYYRKHLGRRRSVSRIIDIIEGVGQNSRTAARRQGPTANRRRNTMEGRDESKPASAFVISNGCHECFIDAALVQQFLSEKRGLTLVDDIAGADLIVLLGCAVMQPKEDQTRELVRLVHEQRRPDSQVIVSGCIAKIRPEVARAGSTPCDGLAGEIEDLIALKGQNGELKANFPYQPYRGHKKDLLGTVAARVRQKILIDSAGAGRWRRRLARRLSQPLVSLLSRYKDFVESRMDVWNAGTYTIKVSTGCRGNCSYCSIRQSRGTVSSKSIPCVVEEFRTGLAKGYNSFALIGTDLGDYGKDRGEDLLDLLNALIDIPGQFRLRLRNVNPRWIIPAGPRFHEVLRSGKVAYIEAPMQSASDPILKRMNRGYRAGEFLDAIRAIKAACPPLLVKTQIIVGFPGERPEDFRKAMDLAKTTVFDYIDVFRYSDRPNTRASSLPNKVPGNVVMKRYRQLFFRSLFHLAPRTLIFRRRGAHGGTSRKTSIDPALSETS